MLISFFAVVQNLRSRALRASIKSSRSRPLPRVRAARLFFVGAVSTAMFLSQDADQPLAAVQNLRGRARRA